MTSTSLTILSPTATTQPTQPSKVATPWTNKLTTPTFHLFTGQSATGLNVPIADSPSESFRQFFMAELIEMIVEQSNLYAVEVMSTDRLDKWNPITVEELEAYLGFNILMGINSVPSLQDYWKKNPIFHYSPIADRISRDRFREISRYLHFADNGTLAPRTSPQYDRLGKIRPILDYLLTRFSVVFTPGEDIEVSRCGC